MQPFTKFVSRVAVMDRSNVDTDQIIPKQFLKRIERTGFGQFLFYDWRFDENGQPRPEFELNLPVNQGANILLARRDFGTGSSREHAVWALADFGFRCIISESFGDIFYNNCFKNGVLPIRLSEAEISNLFQLMRETPQLELVIDLEKKTIVAGEDLTINFEVEEFRRQKLLRGLDDIGLTLQHLNKIEDYERARGWIEHT
ncbi:MAG TPA: 3-isopropylmalate dehydratase small subunit [Pirellulaceae bacterium]|nr:3-isopropylmalate dehydratase small subunit [Pirellulaceae bacterium]HMO94114.1 3-isopropylmalate dehydratase small subunit [Pirellulaceae bacterium]HMP71041.1 3-isopropylmalate dehydratase small subunit [Pirellulaceae bacterium]